MTALSDNIIKLRAQGKSYRQIAEELGCSKGTVSYHLGAGQKEKNVVRVRSGRRKLLTFLQEYKQSRGCTDCGENYPYWMLDFDHLYDKKFTIAKYSQMSHNIEGVMAELEKCEVVCANCHRDRTHNRTTGKYSMDVSEHY